MNNVKLYAFTLFCASLISALLELAAPKKQKKQISYILGLFLLICVMFPFLSAADGIKHFEFSPPDDEIQSIDTDKLLIDEFSARLKKIIEQKLEYLGIFNADTGIEITMSEQGVEINKVLITLPPDYSAKSQAVKEMLFDELNITAEIQIAGG